MQERCRSGGGEPSRWRECEEVGEGAEVDEEGSGPDYSEGVGLLSRQRCANDEGWVEGRRGGRRMSEGRRRRADRRGETRWTLGASRRGSALLYSFAPSAHGPCHRRASKARCQAGEVGGRQGNKIDEVQSERPVNSREAN